MPLSKLQAGPNTNCPQPDINILVGTYPLLVTYLIWVLLDKFLNRFKSDRTCFWAWIAVYASTDARESLKIERLVFIHDLSYFTRFETFLDTRVKAMNKILNWHTGFHPTRWLEVHSNFDTPLFSGIVRDINQAHIWCAESTDDKVFLHVCKIGIEDYMT